MASPDDNLVIIKMPRDGRPFTREKVVEALIDYIETKCVKENFRCPVRKFMQCEYWIRVDWLPAITTEDEVVEHFRKYGNFIKVYKELAPQFRNHPRYWSALLLFA